MAWINQLREAQDNYNEGVPMARKGNEESPEAPRKHTNNNTSSSNRNTPEKTAGSPRGRMRLRTLKQAHNKSRSVDAVTVWFSSKLCPCDFCVHSDAFDPRDIVNLRRRG